MSPPANSYLAPLGDQRWVVARRLRDLTHLIGKRDSLGEVSEAKLPAQVADAVHLDQFPVGDFS